jgi:hypothetical protein
MKPDAEWRRKRKVETEGVAAMQMGRIKSSTWPRLGYANACGDEVP